MIGAGWSRDLSYGTFNRLLDIIADRYQPVRLDELPHIERIGRPLVIMRHDIDVCLARAERIARLESEHGIRATYFIMVSSPLYSPQTDDGADAVRRIRDLGHEIGLHYDMQLAGDLGVGRSIEYHIAESAERLAEITGDPVRSVSFHRPTQSVIRGPSLYGNFINSYAAEYMGWYISDSSGVFRDGDPIKHLLEPKGPMLQFLTHPIWWGDEHQFFGDRLQSLYEERARGREPDFAREFDRALLSGIGMARSNAVNKAA